MQRVAHLSQLVSNRRQDNDYMTSDAPPPAGAPGAPRSRSAAKDVARLAGVSPATVSRVMNTPNSVEPATRQRVLEAAAKLRYVPHGAARTLGASAARTTVVEDTPTGVNAASAAVMRVNGYAAMTPAQRLVKVGADAIATDMDEGRRLLLAA